MANVGHGRLACPFNMPFTTQDFINFTLDQTTDALEVVFQAEEAATITQLGFRYGAATGTPPTYQISLQGVDASGNPDGTIKSSANAKATFTPPADTSWNGTWQWQTLTSSYTCTRGELLSIVIAYSSGTVSGSANSSFTQHSRMFGAGVSGFPYAIGNNAGTRTRGLYGHNVAWKSASATYGRPISNVQTLLIRKDTGVEAAMSFNLPAGWGSTYQVAGFYGALTGDAAADSIRCQLYDTDGTTVLHTYNLDSDIKMANVAPPFVLWTDTNLATLNFGSTYRLGFFGNTNGINHNVSIYDVPAAADMAALATGGATFGYSQRSGGTGAWTDTATRGIVVELILEDWTKPGGGVSRSRIVNA